MLDFTANQKNDDLAKRLTEMFRRETEKKAAKALFLGVSPLALAACGGGGDSSVPQTLVSGTDGNDTLPNSAANERFEGGLGDDTYTVDLSGIDTVVDAGGDDTIKFIWRDEENNLQIKNLHTIGDDLLVEMIGSSNIMTIKGAFAEETRIENIIYYHAAGDFGDGFNARLFKFGEAVSGAGGHLVVGTNGNDTVTLTEGDIEDASLWAANGDDNITTGDGSQYIWGGDGNDTIDSGDGNDEIWGDAGNDVIYAGDGNDTVYGGDGDDIIYSTNGADFEDGGDGNDTMVILGDAPVDAFKIDLSTNSGERIDTGEVFTNTFANFENIKIGYAWGSDEYVGSQVDWTIIGTDGDNVIETGDGDDTVNSGEGNDRIITKDGNDIIDGGDGDDIIYAGAGDDTVYMSPGADIEDGGEGVDTIILGEWAGAYSGTINLETGTNYPLGSTPESASGHQVLNFENITTQNTGNMTIVGTSDDNVIETGVGDDFLEGGNGSDTLTGNGGSDTFVFKQGETDTDTITDFDLAEGDKLDLSSYGITTEEAAEALMSDTAEGVNVTIDGSVIVTMTATTVADFAAVDGWLA